MLRQRTWRNEEGVTYTAYETRDGHWVGARQAPGEPEKFLKTYPTSDDVKAIMRREFATQQDLFRQGPGVQGFDCLQPADCLPGQLDLFE